MEVISLRLKENDIKELEELAKIKKIDRTTLLRQLLLAGITEQRLILARDYYENGASLEQAAERAKVSLWEVIDYFEKIQLTRRFDEKFWQEQLKRELEIN